MKRSADLRVARRRQTFALSGFLLVQVLAAVWGFARLDLGTSLQDGRPVWKLVADSFPVSAVLVVSASAFAVLFGLLLGMVAAVRHNSGVDWGASATKNQNTKKAAEGSERPSR